MRDNLRIAVTHGIRAKIVYEIALGLAKVKSPLLSEVTISFAFGDKEYGGFAGPRLLDEGEFDVGFANPSSITYMALHGLDPFTHSISIKNLAVFPSWDRLGFVVKKSLKIKSLKEIAERKLPLRLSTRLQGREGTTDFTIRKVLNLYGWNLDQLESWGGTVDRVRTPHDPRRLEGLRQGFYDAVFDEGLRPWAQVAMAQDMTFLPLEDEVLKKMEHLGYRRTVIPKSEFESLEEDVPGLEFGGWSLYCKGDTPDELAYAIVKAIDEMRETIPVDGENLEMSMICRDTEDGPMCIPLHPGAEKYYKEHAYL